MKNSENGTIITVFNDISLTNHSCRLNAVVPRANLYAIATIPRDGEVAIEYCATDHPFYEALTAAFFYNPSL